MKNILILIIVFTSSMITAQKISKPSIEDALKEFDFLEEQIIQETDTITYYLKNYKTKPKKLVLFIQGTDANPIFSYKIKDDNPTYYRWFLDDYQHLDSTYTFAIIPKPGMEGLYEDSSISIPKKYYQKNYREYRVNQINKSIEDILNKHVTNPEKVIVYGHSEGAVIAASAAVKNKKITHLGFWSGNVLNNFYEFSLFNRIETLKGNQSDSTAHENIMGIIAWYQNVIDNPNSTELDHFGFTNKRWSTYENPPIEDLLSLDIPIYSVFGTKDESTPIETAYLIPIRFMEKRKKNLNFEVCMNCNHGYVEKEQGQETKHWDQIFKDFIKWTEK